MTKEGKAQQPFLNDIAEIMSKKKIGLRSFYVYVVGCFMCLREVKRNHNYGFRKVILYIII